jgi:hypothetical protein
MFVFAVVMLLAGLWELFYSVRTFNTYRSSKKMDRSNVLFPIGLYFGFSFGALFTVFGLGLLIAKLVL